MTRRRTLAATQWLRWLMGEARMPGRGQRAVVVQLLAVVAVAVAGITAATGTMIHPTTPAALVSETDPPTPPPGSLDLAAGTSGATSSDAPTPATSSTPAAGSSATSPATGSGTGSPRTRTRTIRAPKVPRPPRVKRHGGAAASAGAASATTTTTAPPTTTTTTTATGGWA